METPLKSSSIPAGAEPGESSKRLDLTIVCCVELGRLEEQTILMVRSLRRFGGRLANPPVIAVVGRRGPALRPATLSEFERLRVRVVHAQPADNPAPWLNYANKVAGVVVADRIAQTAQIAWFDSDMFVLAEPSGLLLRDGEDLAAQCHPLPPARLEGDTTHDDYWTRVCALFGVTLTDVEWIAGADGVAGQQLNFTSGLFAWRRGSGFAGRYREAFQTLLASRIAQRSGEFFTADQVVLTPIVTKYRMAWRNLSVEDHSIVLGEFLARRSSLLPDFGKARVLHYSDAFAAPFRAQMEDRLKQQAPDFARWLSDQRVHLGAMPVRSRLAKRLYAVARGLRYRRFARNVLRAN